MWNDRIIRVSRGVLPAGTWENVRARPHPELAAYVREYQGYFEHSSQPLRRREMPSGDFAIIISFGSRYEMIDPWTGGSLGQRCCEFWLGARREEGEYPLWSLTDEQQSTRPKSAQPFGLGRRRRLAALLAR